jgi:hypothetical protein
MPTEVKKDYTVAEGDVRLTVTVGDKQVGASSVFLDQTLVAMGSIEDLFLGHGKDLVNRVLKIKTVVTDVSDTHNHTSTTYQLTGGAVPSEDRLQEDADQDGGTVRYRGTYTFVK